MAPSLRDWLAAPLHSFDIIDSTNNYAMMLLNADKAPAGTTVVAARQTAGKGQRGRQWLSDANDSLMMSLVVTPQSALDGQFIFSASIANAIIQVLGKILPKEKVQVKWPNDIFINDRKAGGILIENVLRGSHWAHAVIGLGLNVRQQFFPEHLPYATSIRKASGQDVEVSYLLPLLRETILGAVFQPQPEERILADYNIELFKRDQRQAFAEGEALIEATVLGVAADGQLQLLLSDGKLRSIRHGELEWIMG